MFRALRVLKPHSRTFSKKAVTSCETNLGKSALCGGIGGMIFGAYDGQDDDIYALGLCITGYCGLGVLFGPIIFVGSPIIVPCCGLALAVKGVKKLQHLQEQKELVKGVEKLQHLLQEQKEL